MRGLAQQAGCTREVREILLPAREREAWGDIPVIVWRSSLVGPRVVLTANLHGDEVNGIAVLHALDAALSETPFGGEVTLIPSLNPPGLAAQTRTVAPGTSDLNRLFPGRRHGEPAARLAHAIWRQVTQSPLDLLIDLHTDAARAIPYVICDRVLHPEGTALEARLRDLASVSGLLVMKDFPKPLYERFQLARSLSGCVVNTLGVPALTIEAGPRRWVSPEHVALVGRALRAMLAFVGVLRTPVPAPEPTPQTWQRASVPATGVSGLVDPQVSPGQAFSRGDTLAVIRSLTGDVLALVSAPADGLLVSWRDLAWAEAGTVTGCIALQEHP